MPERRMREIRQRRGFRLVDACIGTGFSIDKLSKIERCVSDPSLEDATVICTFLGCRLSEAFADMVHKAQADTLKWIS